jgi:ABC-type dipeptide/oligopeptide/nickel transport system permease subunit
MSLQSNHARSAGISDRRIPLLSLLPAALSRTFFAVKFAAIIGIMTVITLDFLRFTSWSSWGHILGDAFDNAAFVTGELDWTLLPVVCIVLLVFGTYMIFDRLERIVLEKFGSGLLQ